MCLQAVVTRHCTLKPICDLKMAVCHYENKALLCYCTQLSSVGARQSLLDIEHNRFFGTDFALSFSPLADIIRISSALQKCHLLELLMKKGPRLAH